MHVSSNVLMTIALVALVVGCASKEQPGVKTDYRSQWTAVAADTKTTTDAARAVLSSYDFKDVRADSTSVDGTATAKKSDGTTIHVSINKTDKGSQVAVNVGTLGDPTLGAEIAQKIKQRAEVRSGQ